MVKKYILVTNKKFLIAHIFRTFYCYLGLFRWWEKNRKKRLINNSLCEENKIVELFMERGDDRDGMRARQQQNVLEWGISATAHARAKD